MQRVMVTGCAGFVGSHLCESLLADGIEVVGIDCFNDNYGRPQKMANLARALSWDVFDFVPVDLSRGNLDDLVEGCHAVFHLAAEPGVRASWGQRFEAYVRNNILATHHLLEAVSARPGARFVYASSSSVYGQAETFPTPETALPRPRSPYGVTKLAAEHLCQLYTAERGLASVSLRFFTVYGPRQRPDMAFSRFISAILAGDPITVFGDGSQTRDFTFVGDIVRALREAETSRDALGKVLNIGGGAQTSLNETLEILFSLAGRTVDVHRTSAEPGDVRDTGADTTRARSVLAYEPRVRLAQGLERQLAWNLAAPA